MYAIHIVQFYTAWYHDAHTRAHTHTHAHTIPTTTRPRLEHAPPMRHQATPPLGTSTRENHRNGMTPKRQNTPNPSANTHIHTHTYTRARQTGNVGYFSTREDTHVSSFFARAHEPTHASHFNDRPLSKTRAATTRHHHKRTGAITTHRSSILVCRSQLRSSRAER